MFIFEVYTHVFYFVVRILVLEEYDFECKIYFVKIRVGLCFITHIRYIFSIQARSQKNTRISCEINLNITKVILFKFALHLGKIYFTLFIYSIFTKYLTMLKRWFHYNNSETFSLFKVGLSYLLEAITFVRTNLLMLVIANTFFPSLKQQMLLALQWWHPSIWCFYFIGFITTSPCNYASSIVRLSQVHVQFVSRRGKSK